MEKLKVTTKECKTFLSLSHFESVPDSALLHEGIILKSEVTWWLNSQVNAQSEPCHSKNPSQPFLVDVDLDYFPNLYSRPSEAVLISEDHRG